MSFSSDVKAELAEAYSSARHCQIAEIAAMLSMDGQIFEDIRGGRTVVLRTENLAVARKYFTLLKKTFNIEADILIRRSVVPVSYTHLDVYKRQLIACGYGNAFL